MGDLVWRRPMCVGDSRLRSSRHSALIMGGVASGPIPTANCIFFINLKHISFGLEKVAG